LALGLSTLLFTVRAKDHDFQEQIFIAIKKHYCFGYWFNWIVKLRYRKGVGLFCLWGVKQIGPTWKRRRSHVNMNVISLKTCYKFWIQTLARWRWCRAHPRRRLLIYTWINNS